MYLIAFDYIAHFVLASWAEGLLYTIGFLNLIKVPVELNVTQWIFKIGFGVKEGGG